MVGHATTVDVCTRQLVGGKIRSFQEMSKLLLKVPYCSMTMIEEDEEKKEPEERKWALKELPFPPITQTNNMRFDWKVLLT